MRKLLLYVLTISLQILISFNAGAADGYWKDVSPNKNLLKNFRDITFVNSDTGWAVSGDGLIIKTTDGGKNWTKQLEAKNEIFNLVYFIDENTGFASYELLNSYVDSIYKTTDGGKVWTKKYIDGSFLKIRSMQIINNKFVYICYNLNNYGTGRLRKSTDGGETWFGRLNFFGHFNSSFFTDIFTGYVVGKNGIRKTIDSGAKWTKCPITTTKSLNFIHFTDEFTGYVVGDSGAIFKTIDSGANWIELNSGTTRNLFKLFFLNQNTGWAVGDSCTMLKTTDAGNNWEALYSKTSDTISGIYFTDADNGWIVGSKESFLRSKDGGKNWTSHYKGTDKNLSKLYFTDSKTGWAVGDSGTIIKTTDSGETWTKQNSGTYQNLSAVHFLNQNTGWAVGTGITVKTTNGGYQWVTVGTNDYYYPPQTVWFVDDNLGFLGYVILRKTTNSGAVWERYAGQGYIEDDIRKIQFPDKNTGYAFALEHHFLKTTDGGLTWSWNSFSVFCHDAHFIDANTGFASGGDGIYGAYGTPYLVKTTDGGDSWTEIEIDKRMLMLIYFSDENTGWGVDYKGKDYEKIIHTVDGGKTWKIQNIVSNNGLNCMFFTDKDHGWVAGNDGVIFKYNPNYLPKIELIYPQKDTLGLNLNKFVWRKVDNVTKYLIRISTDYNFENIIDTAVVADTMYVPAVNLKNIKYYWKVFGYEGSPNVSSVWSFTKMLPKTELVYPPNDTANVPLETYLKWNPVADAYQYDIEISQDSLFNKIDISLTQYNMDSILVELNNYPETKLYWRVRAHNSFSTGEWSDIWVFNISPKTSVDELSSEQSGITVIPNPSNDKIKIIFNNDDYHRIKISILDITGREIDVIYDDYCGSGQNELNYNLTNLNSGIYFIKIGNKVQKFIKM